DAYHADPGHFAMAADGTTVGVWEQETLDGLGHELVSRKFRPGKGWGAPQVIGPIWQFPTPAISPDGRAFLVYADGANIVARTLAPEEDVWSGPSDLLATASLAAYAGEAQVVAVDGLAYTVFHAVTGDRLNPDVRVAQHG